MEVLLKLVSLKLKPAFLHLKIGAAHQLMAPQIQTNLRTRIAAQAITGIFTAKCANLARRAASNVIPANTAPSAKPITCMLLMAPANVKVCAMLMALVAVVPKGTTGTNGAANASNAAGTVSIATIGTLAMPVLMVLNHGRDSAAA